MKAARISEPNRIEIVEVEKPECVFCHEALAGVNYSCPSCHKKYCFKCAAKHSFCIKCGSKMQFNL